MAKYRFRLYDKEFEQMVHPDSGYNDYNLLAMNGIPVQANDYGVSSIEADVMMSVGIDDKNGKEIFEGDIIKIVHPHKGRTYTGKIEWGYGKFEAEGFYFPHQDEPNDFLESVQYAEVIGNIYENPELLESTSL